MAPPESPESPESPEGREITTTRDGVTVSKTADTEQFPVPTIVFEIRSARATRATVRVLDIVPEDIRVEDVGFHTDYGIDCWEVIGDAVVFERDFEPGEEYLTVYGVRSVDKETIERLLTDPEIGVTDAEERIETERTIAEHASTAEHTPNGVAPIDDATIPAAATADDVATALAAQLRRGNVDDAALDTLRDALGERITRLEGADTDADTGTEATKGETSREPERGRREMQPNAGVESPTYRLVTNDPPADLSAAEIGGELRDIATLSEAERREYEERGLDIEARERELVAEVAERSTDKKQS